MSPSAINTLLATQAAGEDPVGVPAGIIVLFVALAAGLIVRRVWPAGIGEGLFTAALSGLMVLYYADYGNADSHDMLVAASLTSLAIVWFVVAAWIERGPADPEDDPAPERRILRQIVAVHACAVAGLLAVGALYHADEHDGVSQLAALTQLSLLFVVALGAYLWRGGALPRQACIGLAVSVIWFVIVPRIAIARNTHAVALGLLGLGAIALLAIVAILLGDWHRRRRQWRVDPKHLLEPAPPHGGADLAIGVTATVVGIGGLCVPEAVPVPFALAFAALAVFIIGHRTKSNAVGELGLALTVAFVYTAARAWLPASPANGLLGLVLGGIWMLWLPRVWTQQLDDGRPWTTAGRLVPVARGVAYVAVGAQVVWVTTWALRPGPVGGWQVIAAALLMLLQWSMLVRTAREQRSIAAALVACMGLLAALVPIAHFGSKIASGTAILILMACAGLVLALRVSGPGTPRAVRWIYHMYIGGVIPLAVLYQLVSGHQATTSRAGEIFAVVLVAAAALWHWGIRGVKEPATPAE